MISIDLFKFCSLVLLCFTKQLIPALFSFVYFLIRDKKRFFNAWLNIDFAIANDLFGEFRTLSDIAGENKLKDIGHWRVIANFIDKLAVMFGDKPNHCIRAYEWHLSRLPKK